MSHAATYSPTLSAHPAVAARNEKDPYAPVGAIYKLDTRTGWAEFLDLIQPTAICITHNLLHLFKVTLKTEEAIEDTKVIDAYHKDLDLSLIHI